MIRRAIGRRKRRPIFFQCVSDALLIPVPWSLIPNPCPSPATLKAYEF